MTDDFRPPDEPVPNDGFPPAAGHAWAPFPAVPYRAAPFPAAPAVYERLVALCHPYRADPPWDRFPDADAYLVPTDPAEVLDGLRRKFSEGDLMRSRALTAVPGGGPGGRLFAGAGDVLIALRAADGRPLDVVTDRGTLGGTLPVLAAADAVPAGGIADGFEEVLCVAFSARDVAALRSLGVPAITATGLERLDGDALETFFGNFGEAAGGAQLAFLAWSPAAPGSGPPPRLAAVRAHFAELRRLGWHFPEAYVWNPAPGFEGSIASALGQGTRDDVRHLLLESLDGATESLVTAPGSLAAVFAGPGGVASDASLIAQVARRGDEGLRELAWRNYEVSLERDLIRPLRECRGPSGHPLLGSLGAAAADLSRQVHLEMTRAVERPAAAGLSGVDRRVLVSLGMRRGEGADLRRILGLSRVFVQAASGMLRARGGARP